MKKLLSSERKKTFFFLSIFIYILFEFRIRSNIFFIVYVFRLYFSDINTTTPLYNTSIKIKCSSSHRNSYPVIL
ncbi:hypothetical protein PGB90_003606 [Kerria lacca]